MSGVPSGGVIDPPLAEPSIPFYSRLFAVVPPKPVVSAFGATLDSDAVHKSFSRGIGSPIIKHIIRAVIAIVPH